MENLEKGQTPKKEIENKNYPKLELMVKRTQILANIFVCMQIILIIIALIQYNEAKKFNKHQIERDQKNELIASANELSKNAIEAINKIYNKEFLSSFSKLDRNSTLTDERTRDAFIFVLNNYYIVAVVYNSGIANNDLIEESIKIGILQFTSYKVYTSNKDEKLESAKIAIDKMISNFNPNTK
ncbi:MAG: hypothetical protein WC319_06710 [Candidatus Paceibacterota bacterium]|jgi:hypothetical protein